MGQEKKEERRSGSSGDINQSFVEQRRNILGKNSSFYVREAYKTLRTNIRFVISGEGCQKFCITSGLASEGKSITILNLAISFAETGKKVLLIDADMRRPSQARLLIEKASPGLSNVLAGLCTPEEAIRKEQYPNLDILFSGEIPPNPSELLGGERMRNLIEKAEKVYDYILVDTPPVGIVTDACVVASFLDGVLFLVRQNESDRDSVTQGVKLLELAGVKLLGFVLNGFSPEGGKYYGTKYKYRRKYYRYKKYGYRRGYGYGYGYGYGAGKHNPDGK